MVRIKKGDLVEVVSGKEKGRQAKILKIMGSKVLLEGVNRVKRHTKPSQKNPRGGIVEKEAPLHASNILPVDSKTGKGGRLRMEVKDGKRLRCFVKTGTELK